MMQLEDKQVKIPCKHFQGFLNTLGETSELPTINTCRETLDMLVVLDIERGPSHVCEMVTNCVTAPKDGFHHQQAIHLLEGDLHLRPNGLVNSKPRGTY